MNVAFINGGLANQMYQYIFSRYFTLRTGQEIYLDTSTLENRNQHNGFEIGKVFPNAKFKLLKDQFDSDVWEFMKQEMGQNRFITQVFLENQVDFHVIVEGPVFPPEQFFLEEEKQKELVNHINPDSFSSTPSVIDEVMSHKSISHLYFAGYFIKDDFINAYTHILEEELKFPPLPEGKNQEYLKCINQSFSVGVHVRRGDFLSPQFNWGLPANHYHTIITELKKETKKVHHTCFFIFSDDLQWCKENLKEMGFLPEDQVILIEGNTGANSYIDLQLMCECEIMIGSRSSFCLAVSYLSKKLKHYIGAPPRSEHFDLNN